MDKLYIPTSSLNFNNIFSSESISPVNFYKSRYFGYRRFESIDPNPLQNSLLLYSKYPRYEIKDEEKDNYPMVIEIPRDLLSEKLTLCKQHNGVEVFQFNDTVYLNPFDILIYFSSEDHLKTTLIKSEPSLETKMVSTYNPRLTVIDGNMESFDCESIYYSGINDCNESDILQSIEKDKHINRIKGFAYCYLIGATSNLPLEVLELKKLFKDINNIASSIFNIYQASFAKYTNPKDKKNFLPKDTYYEVKNRAEDLSKKIARFNNLISALNTKEQKPISLEKEVFNKYNFSENDIEKVIALLKNLKSGKYTLYEHFKWAIEHSNSFLKSPTINELDKLAMIVNTLVNTAGSQNYYQMKDINNIFVRTEEYIIDIENSIIRQNKKINLQDTFAISNLRLTALMDEQLKRKSDFYRDLINCLIDFPIDSVEHFKTSRAELTFSCGKIIKEYVQNNNDWEGSKERAYMNALLDNIESYRPFDIKSHSSEILQSLAAFILKGDDPERLLEFLNSNGIKDSRISLGFWGATFGFADIPRTLTKDFLLSEQSYLDLFFKSLYRQLFGFDIGCEQESPTGDNSNPLVIHATSDEYNAQNDSKPDITPWHKIESYILNNNLSKTQTRILKENYDKIYGLLVTDSESPLNYIDLLKEETKKSKAKKEGSKLNEKIIGDIAAIITN